MVEAAAGPSTGQIMAMTNAHGAGGATKKSGAIQFMPDPFIAPFQCISMGGKGLLGLMSGVKDNMLGQITATPALGGVQNFTQGFNEGPGRGAGGGGGGH